MTTTLEDLITIGSTEYQRVRDTLAPLFTWRGRDVYPILGAEGDDDGGGDPDGEPGDDDDDAAGEPSTGGDQDTVSREDFEKLRNQLSAADKNRAALEKRLKEIDDAKKDELTKATERAEELEKKVGEQDKELAGLRLQNAFLTADTGVTWYDPADALDIAERRGYLEGVVGEDGKVDVAKLSAKLKELAKAKPNLVKSDGSNSGNTNPPTGRAVGSKGNGGKQGGDKLPSRYDRILNR
jgi:hypothetical protein